MKQKLVQIAKYKGFISTFVYDKPFLHSSKEPLRWLFWMSELQKWLRETYDIHVYVESIIEKAKSPIKFEYFILYDISKDGIKNNCLPFHTYEEALETGLFEALKLITNEPKK